MPRRDAGAASESGRHARSRLQAALGETSRGLLLEAGAASSSTCGGSAASGVLNTGRSPASEGLGSDESYGVGPAVRWRLDFRLGVFLGVLAVAAAAWFWWQAAITQPEVQPVSGASPGSTAVVVEEGTPAGDDGGGSRAGPEPNPQGSVFPATVVVHVAGSVLKAGVVELPGGSRVHEAIAAAGGAAPGADLGRLNLAVVVTDGQKIHVPQEGETTPPDGDSGAPAAGDVPQGIAGEPSGSKVNLNTAGVNELDGLPKVGPVLAQRIVDWRKEHGPFKAVDDLDAIDGVGPKLLETLMPLVTV